MLLFWPKRKPITKFTPNNTSITGDRDLLKKGMSMIDRHKGTLKNYGINAPSITTIPTGGFAGRNQIGGQSAITIIRNPPTKTKSSSGSNSRISVSASSYVDDGKGPAMSESARRNFIKGKNPDYIVKKTPQGATYGVRQIV